MNNMRGQPSITNENLPTWLTEEEPFKSRLIVTRPEKDYGPIMKFIGSLDQIPLDSFVFICDDDQYYQKDYISRCVAKVQTLPPDEQKISIINGFQQFDDALGFYKSMFNIDLIYGYNGLLVHRNYLEYIQSCPIETLKPCCLRNDDDVVSIWGRNKGYKKVTIPCGVDSARLNEGTEALGTSYNRAKDRHECHATINSDYANGLLTAIIILVSFCLFFLFVFILMLVLYFKKSKQLQLKNPGKSKKYV
jgi:hypothetical protein